VVPIDPPPPENAQKNLDLEWGFFKIKEMYIENG
jgi:hypothetical protein